ncbi:TRAP transporter small permease [Ferrovibrio sp.]|uniref:TRAP transporter small permease n=1 Tax=Ferrovibrio sp. TaxID=1917215 RepID=UPI003D0A06AD
MQGTQRILDFLANALMAIGAACILLMMLQVMAEVVLRTVFKLTIPGTEETVSAYYMIGCAFTPLAWVQRQKGHVMIEIFTLWMKPRQAAAMDGVVYLVCAVAVGIFAYAGFTKAWAMTLEDEILIGSIDVVVWPSRWLVPAGLILMLAYMVLQAFDELRFAILGGERSLAATPVAH